MKIFLLTTFLLFNFMSFAASIETDTSENRYARTKLIVKEEADRIIARDQINAFSHSKLQVFWDWIWGRDEIYHVIKYVEKHAYDDIPLLGGPTL